MDVSLARLLLFGMTRINNSTHYITCFSHRDLHGLGVKGNTSEKQNCRMHRIRTVMNNSQDAGSLRHFTPDHRPYHACGQHGFRAHSKFRGRAKQYSRTGFAAAEKMFECNWAPWIHYSTSCRKA